MKTVEKITLSQERNFSDIITDTFTLIRHGFKSLGKALLYTTGPMIVVIAIIMGIINSETMALLNPAVKSGIQADMRHNLFAESGMLYGAASMLFGFLSLLVTAFFQAYSYEYMLQYEKRDYADITYSDIISAGKKHIIKMLVTNIGMFAFLIVFMAGFIAAFVTAGESIVSGKQAFSASMPIVITVTFILMFYYMICISLVPAIRIFEGTGFFASIKKSFYLMYGNFWNTFGLLFVSGIIISFMSSIFMVPYLVLSMFIGFHSGGANIASLPHIKPLMIASYSLVGLSFFMYVIPFINIAFKYLSLKEKKEGSGLMKRIESLTDGDAADSEK